MVISIQNNNVTFDKNTNTFRVKGADVGFATQYQLVNLKTDNYVIFNFDHSTGSEWDRSTEWIYKSVDDKYTLIVGNEEVTNSMIANYENAKMR